MFYFIKRLYWDLKHRDTRFHHINAFLMRIPGHFGMELRGRLLPRYFASAGKGLLVHEGVRIRGVKRLSVGDNVEIGVDNFIQASGGVKLGDDVMIGPGAKIWSINHKFDNPDTSIRDQGYDYEEVTIGDHVWIGANAFVMPGVTIPEGCVISACAMVNKKKYPPYSLIAGSPARVIGNRKKEKPAPTPAPVS